MAGSAAQRSSPGALWHSDCGFLRCARGQWPCTACACLQAFPANYDDALRDMQAATKAAIHDGKLLLEVEFPTSGLDSVAGDGEGQNEMTSSLEYLRRFLVMFQVGSGAATTRVFFPDKSVRAPCGHDREHARAWHIEPAATGPLSAAGACRDC
jgi:Domain of unknown function (DUF1995)